MTVRHAIVVFVLGSLAITIPLSVLCFLSGLWGGWLMTMNNPFGAIDVAVSMTGIIFSFVLIIWPLIGYWADLLITAYGSGD